MKQMGQHVGLVGGVIGQDVTRPHQEPAALVEAQCTQGTGLGLQRHPAFHLSVLDDLQKGDVVPAGKLCPDVESKLTALRSGEHVPRQLVGHLHAQKWAVRDEALPHPQGCPPLGIAEFRARMDIHAVVADGIGQDPGGAAGLAKGPKLVTVTIIVFV